MADQWQRPVISSRDGYTMCKSKDIEAGEWWIKSLVMHGVPYNTLVVTNNIALVSLYLCLLSNQHQPS